VLAVSALASLGVGDELDRDGFGAEIDLAFAGDRAVRGVEHQRLRAHDALLHGEIADEAPDRHHFRLRFLVARQQQRHGLADVQPDPFQDQRVKLPAAHDERRLALRRPGEPGH
jgi:hypothetical protein